MSQILMEIEKMQEFGELIKVLKLLIILGFVLMGLSVFFSVRSDNAKKVSDDGGYKKYKILSGVSMGLAVLIIAGSGIAFFSHEGYQYSNSVNSGYSSKEDDFGHDETDAWIVAQDIVDKKLKSPSTADYCRKSEATIIRDGNTWMVDGYVDAKNSLGVTLRTEFSVSFTFTGQKYKVNYCRIN